MIVILPISGEFGYLCPRNPFLLATWKISKMVPLLFWSSPCKSLLDDIDSLGKSASCFVSCIPSCSVTNNNAVDYTVHAFVLVWMKRPGFSLWINIFCWSSDDVSIECRRVWTISLFVVDQTSSASLNSRRATHSHCIRTIVWPPLFTVTPVLSCYALVVNTSTWSGRSAIREGRLLYWTMATPLQCCIGIIRYHS